MDSTPTQRIYLGTGGYSDTDLLGTLYPTITKKNGLLTRIRQGWMENNLPKLFHDIRVS